MLQKGPDGSETLVRTGSAVRFQRNVDDISQHPQGVSSTARAFNTWMEWADAVDGSHRDSPVHPCTDEGRADSEQARHIVVTVNGKQQVGMQTGALRAHAMLACLTRCCVVATPFPLLILLLWCRNSNRF